MHSRIDTVPKECSNKTTQNSTKSLDNDLTDWCFIFLSLVFFSSGCHCGLLMLTTVTQLFKVQHTSQSFALTHWSSLQIFSWIVSRLFFFNLFLPKKRHFSKAIFWYIYTASFRKWSCLMPCIEMYWLNPSRVSAFVISGVLMALWD